MNPLANLGIDELAALRAAFNATRQSLLIVDVDNQTIVDVNPAACKTLRMQRGQLIGSSWTATAGSLPRTSLRNVGAAGDRYAVIAHETETGSERRGLARDPLTGLATREALAARISWDAHPTAPSRAAVLFIDLDDFKRINDLWGHTIGDRVLQTVAERMVDCIRPSDLLVRYGGDEFVIVVEDVRRRRDLDRLARRLLRSVRLPIAVGKHEFVVGASLGMAQRSSRHKPIDALIAEADRAMYQAKQGPKGAAMKYPDIDRPEADPLLVCQPGQSLNSSWLAGDA
jgi:diguanylate cyclase (GGDEF)-like protein